MSTATTTARAANAARIAEALSPKFDNCPSCGFHFPRPQARCKSQTACDKRTAKLLADRAKTEAVPADVAIAAIAAGEVDEPIVAEAKPVKVEIVTAPQRALVEMMSWTGLRSGKAGRWLLVFPHEIEEVRSLFHTVLEREDKAFHPSAKALLARIDKAVGA